MPGDSEIDLLKNVECRDGIVRDLFLDFVGGGFYILGDGHSSHCLIDWCDVFKKELKVNFRVLEFYKKCFEKGFYPSILFNYIEGGPDDGFSFDDKEKVSFSEISGNTTFKENIRYFIVRS